MTGALIAISLVALIALALLAWLVWKSKSPNVPADAGIDKALDLLLRDTQSLKIDQKLSQESAKEFKTEMRSITEVIAEFKARQEERDKKEEGYNSAIQSSVKNIESLFKGSKSKGAAGENILREIFKLFPPELIVFDYRIAGRPVEFGLKLPDGRIVPMDSKVVAVEEMGRLETEQDEEIRSRLIKKVELEVAKKIKEVAVYIHPPITWDRALMLIPDALYSILKEAFSRAYSQSVILIPYSMAVPYILTFLDLHKRTLATYDEQQIKSFLEDLDRSLTEMEIILENQIARGNTMISNAYNEYKKLVGKVRGRMTYLAEAEKPLAVAGARSKLNQRDNIEE